MKRFCILLFLLSASFSSAAPVLKALKKRTLPDRERILGEWKIVVYEHDGRPSATDVNWIFTEDKMISKSPKSSTYYEIHIDPDATPKRFDIVGFAGIYDFDGDKLKIAYLSGNIPPVEFSSKNRVSYCELEKVSK